MLELLLAALVVLAFFSLAYVRDMLNEATRANAQIRELLLEVQRTNGELHALHKLVSEGGAVLAESIGSSTRSMATVEGVARQFERYALPSKEVRAKIDKEAWPFKQEESASDNEV